MEEHQHTIYSLWPDDTIWWHKSGSTLAYVMFVALLYQVITCTNVDLPVRSNGIYLIFTGNTDIIIH